MQKVLLVAGGVIAGFVLAVVISRFLLAGDRDTTIKLATGAPEIPASLSESQPLATKDAAGTAASPEQQAAPAGSSQPGAPASPEPAQAPAPPPYLHFKSDPSQSKATLTVTQGSIMGDSLLYGYGSNVTGDVFLTPAWSKASRHPSSLTCAL
jgi:hypothetical protein